MTIASASRYGIFKLIRCTRRAVVLGLVIVGQPACRRTGSVVRNLAAGSRPGFSRDAKTVVFSAPRNGASQVYLKDVTSGKVRALSFGASHSMPSLSPDAT